ncbi:MAG: aminopeptidase [bacterium]|nr:aminopeptidase [bacterium]
MKVPAKILGLIVVALATGGCARLGYYAHLGGGALGLMTRGRNIDKLVAQSDTPAELKERLVFARDLRAFAAAELDLPVDGRYEKYLDLERPYVVWTVVAAPEFGLEPRTWCFPIAGCVAYRGFFSRAKAERFAEKLRGERMDVSVGGVRAFSSLGWMGDPLLSTFLFSGDRDVAALLFHELAHAVVYVKDDSAFNESFATAVERAGVLRWLARTEDGNAGDRAEDYRSYLARGDRAYDSIATTRARLEELYAGDDPNQRARKAELFQELEGELLTLAGENDSPFSGWIGRELNNADLAGLGLYREWLGALTALLGAVDGNLAPFYSGARCLAELDLEERRRRLDARDWTDCILAGSEKPE